MIRPGVIALLLIVLMAFSLGIHVDRSKTILDKAYSQVVIVYCQETVSGHPEYGTGWFIDHSHIITASHVVDSCLDDPRLIRSPWTSNATVVANDPVLDVALLRVDNPPSWAEGLPLSEKVAIGDEVYVVGYPIQLYEETGKNIETMSEIPRVQRATVTWINPEKRIFEFSPGTDAGNSGGPIVSVENGGVVGIVIYARPGIVSEGYYGLRMDGLAQFLSDNGIEYRVAGSYSWAWILGLGALTGLGFLIVSGKAKGVRVWK